ncbi:redoxin domain-containing protein [Bacillus lacus]|uniref:Glutathione peroxidase n=1 Tax=Metabacillus lacus TaxID=1983721 RepID=A0A7X2IWJ4_9BACI|nr:glutathione peroxidase [Metabacillus lacus]MRX70914.1 redoxin domain-containing protein [Metabacillus lacus]
MSIYEYSAKTILGKEVSMKEYEGKTVLIVNTASKCGFTPQFKQLQELYDKHAEHGLEILGFPCNQFMNQDPGTEEDIKDFCEVNYGVKFPMFSKVDVNGESAHPLFKYLTAEAPGLMGSKAVKWNFTKFLVDHQGKVIQRYSPNTSPADIEKDIEELLREAAL